MTLFLEEMKSNTLPESLSRPCFVVMRVLAARGVRAPSSRRPGGLNAHYSGGQILFFVSPRGEHLHDGVTPRPTEKNFQPLSRSPLFSPFSDPLARKSAQKRGAARSQTRPREVAAEAARAHGADPQSARLLSEPASCRLRGGS